MNEAMLERLMMDAALGALTDDVQELLMAHLAGDEKKVREAEALNALVAKAREAVKENCPAQPDLQAARRQIRIERTVQWGARILAMAACLLIGFGIARMRPAKQVEVVVRQKPANPPVVAVNVARPEVEGELWSAQRIYRNAIEVNRTEKPKAGMKRIFQ
jgi:anti-sigma factor RsiW